MLDEYLNELKKEMKILESLPSEFNERRENIKAEIIYINMHKDEIYKADTPLKRQILRNMEHYEAIRN